MKPSKSPSEPRPVSTRERSNLLDALRGFAVLGILIANMQVFSGYDLISPEQAAQLGTRTAERLGLFLINVLVDGKFYSLFSFLFGLGFALQTVRAGERGANFIPVFKRRLSILLLIGLAHAWLLWYGDILSIYAVIGFLLIPFRKCSDKTLIRWAVGLLLSPIAIYGIMTALKLPDPFAALTVFTLGAEGGDNPGFDTMISTFAGGSYLQIFRENLIGLLYRYLDLLYTSRFPKVLGMFLIGLYVGRGNLFSDTARHLPLVRRVMWWSLGIGLVGNTALARIKEIGADTPPNPRGLLQTVAYAAGVPSLCLFYVCALTLLWHTSVGSKLLGPLAPAGRMALTNYLSQTLICVLIFYGYGLGLFGQVGVVRGTALAAAIFLGQVVVNAWWLERFQYGPVEWVWRRLTYERPLAFRLPA